jgi:hypothetical protein
MDMNRLLQMIWRQFGGKLINLAMKKGVDHLDRRAGAQNTSPAQRAQADQARHMAKRLQQIRKVTGRFF